MNDADPYETGAMWVHNNTGSIVKLLDVFTDDLGLVAGGQEGDAYVTVTDPMSTMPLTWPVTQFLSLYTRPDGSTPMVAFVPRQRNRDKA